MSGRRVDFCLRQNGVALITVLLVIAILTAMLGRLSLVNEIWFRQVEGGATLARAYQVNRAAQRWIRLILEEDNNRFDGRTDIWAQPIPPMPVERGTLHGRIEDMQGRFNLNNLVGANGKIDATAMQQFSRLLSILELNPDLAQAVADWIDPDAVRTGPWGAEDGYYIGLDPPYLAANRPFGDSRELRLVRGIDQASFERLRPHITALPQSTKINVNTATVEVLAAAVIEWGTPDNALGRAREWRQRSLLEPAPDMEAFNKSVPDSRGEPLPTSLSIKSVYFTAYTEVRYGDTVYRKATLYERRRGRGVIIRHTRELR